MEVPVLKQLISGGLALLACTAIPALGQAKSQEPAPGAAETGSKVFWLVMRGGDYDAGYNYFSIPTASREQCEISGAEFLDSKRLRDVTRDRYAGFECLEGIR